MSRFGRVYKIHELLRAAHYPVPMRVFMDELEASRNTVTRDFEFLRDTLSAPLEYCREYNGHRYNPDAPVFELPGFWMTPAELYALLACEQLLENVQPDLIATHLAPLRQKVQQLLGKSGHAAEQVSERIRIHPIQNRTSWNRQFGPLAQATLTERRLELQYLSRSSSGAPQRRIVHPQRMLHYRSNWYLLAFCEKAGELRLFSLDRISSVCITAISCRRLSNSELDAFVLSGFGIFGGQAKDTAHLRFSEHAAKWVAEETWHPNQKGQWQADGYHLKVPYADDRELVMEVLRYGGEVEVLAPEALRKKVVCRIEKMMKIYR
ncbi:helix-turn-helix transcriptional regulator [Vreelandella zhaodongensis]|uniref:helix-turn-helix transcriptional regulator n=1 Tax=Vreelandella zhaodongensis TaxID=1176240 RepID=UPI003EB94F88